MRRIDSPSNSHDQIFQPSAFHGRLRALVTALAATAVLTQAGCAVHRAPVGLASAASPCQEGRAGTGQAAPMRWALRHDPSERRALDAWCWGVGPVVMHDVAGVAPAPAIDSLAVVVWNNHEGEGDLAALLRDLRSGALTGAPVREFVLLLQEVYRGGPAVPADMPAWAVGASRIGDPGAPGRVDVVAEARRAGLSLLYAPSMRNGLRDDAGPPEDRGNAILSTLPLSAPTLVELPYERQRRVVVEADIAGHTSHGRAWRLHLVSAHLDNRARFGRFFRSFGAARLRQARTLAAELPDGPTVLGGDLNTWVRGAASPAVQALRDRLPGPAVTPTGATAPLPGPLPSLRLDYLFFRLPDGSHGRYHVLDRTYGSDHRPLIGWITLAHGSTTL